jgi:hypothetical protein
MSGESVGPKGPIGLGRVDSIAIGAFVVRNVPVHTMDTEPFAVVFSGLNVKGVIGTRLLMHFPATIDYVDGSLLLQRITPVNTRNPEAHVEAECVKVIPMWLIQTHFIVAWGRANGKEPTLFFVDTGLTGKAFAASGSTLQETGISVDWTNAEEGVGGFGKAKEVDIVLEQLALGTESDEVVEHTVPGVPLQKPPSVLGDRLGFRIGGLVSHQFFRTYSLTLDFTEMGLLLKEASNGGGVPHPEGYSRR